MSIKLVIFDADNTLVDFFKCERYALQNLFNQLDIMLTDEIVSKFSKIDDNLWRTGNWKGFEVAKEDIPTKRFELLFRDSKLEPIDYHLANKIFMEAFKTAVFPLKESHETVEYLYNKGISICVATNGIVELQYPRIKNTSFGKYITQIVASEEVAENKPSPKIFLKILDDNNVLAYEAIVVGDSLANDIQGAKGAGIKAIWYNPNKYINNLKIIPDYEISSMSEIKEIINELCFNNYQI